MLNLMTMIELMIIIVILEFIRKVFATISRYECVTINETDLF